MVISQDGGEALRTEQGEDYEHWRFCARHTPVILGLGAEAGKF